MDGQWYEATRADSPTIRVFVYAGKVVNGKNVNVVGVVVGEPWLTARQFIEKMRYEVRELGAEEP